MRLPCIEPLFESNIISKIGQIGIRYISNFDDIYIYEHINANIQLDFIQGSVKGQSKFEFAHGNKTVLLNLLNGGVVVNSEPSNSQKFSSIIDIDVIQRQPNVSSISELVGIIGEMHEVEKNIFFSLLKDSFLVTLNPVY